VGSLIGVGAGWLTTLLIRKDWLPVSLHKFGVLALVLVTFTLSDWLSHESGLLAVTVFGIWLANQEGLDLEEVLAFKEDLAVILISSSSSCWRPASIWPSSGSSAPWCWPCCAWCSSWPAALHPGLDPGSDLPWRARALLAWIAPGA
jgi:NhaP-type Na+/H+ or K+/H+ antiporter